MTYKTMRPGSFDPAARVEDMETDGVSAEVLYPGIARSLAQFSDPDVRRACAVTYNDWIAHLQSYDPHRLIGLAVLPLVDDGVDAAVEELSRCVRLGLRGAFLPPPENLILSDPILDLLWAAAASQRIPISMHIGAGKAHLRYGQAAVKAGGELPLAWILAMDLVLAGARGG